MRGVSAWSISTYNSSVLSLVSNFLKKKKKIITFLPLSMNRSTHMFVSRTSRENVPRSNSVL